jgi:hypothetical protein
LPQTKPNITSEQKINGKEKKGTNMMSSSVPKSFLFGSLPPSRQKSPSLSPSPSSSATSSTSPRSPRFSAVYTRPELSSLHSPPLAEIRARSGSTAEPPRKRSGTLSTIASFWEGRKDTEKEREREKEKHHKDDHKHDKKEQVRLHKEEKKEREKEKKRSFRSKEANTVISTEVLAAVQGLNDIQRSKPNTCSSPSSPRSPKTSPPSSPRLSKISPPSSPRLSKTSPPSSPRTPSSHPPSPSLTPTPEAPKKTERVKHKARSEGSLLSAIFSRKLDRGAIMQKSSSLIELKPVGVASSATTSKSGSAIEIGKKPGYFGVTLQEAMDLQKEKYPNLRVPVIIVKLTEAILLFEGCKAEGIFRVAGSTQQVQKMQQQFNVMNFDEISSDPHVLVGVLKQWLRELREPLIPNSIYAECLQCETTMECLKVIGKMPELNKVSFAHFVVFLRELAKPEHLPYTKMDVHNLCLVSAPVLFRCPSTDMAELVVNMQKEKVFLGLVLESPAFTE